jgi:hypothetical protein
MNLLWPAGAAGSCLHRAGQQARDIFSFVVSEPANRLDAKLCTFMLAPQAEGFLLFVPKLLLAQVSASQLGGREFSGIVAQRSAFG